MNHLNTFFAKVKSYFRKLQSVWFIGLNFKNLNVPEMKKKPSAPCLGCATANRVVLPTSRLMKSDTGKSYRSISIRVSSLNIKRCIAIASFGRLDSSHRPLG
jgi:hypothetical protein